MTDYPHVFEPVEIGPVTVPNRLYFGPHGNPLEVGRGPSEDFAAYYEERAAAGVGLLLQSLPISHRAVIGRACPSVDESVPAFAAVAERVHRHGARIFGQINYFYDINSQWEPQTPFAPNLSPSGQQRFSTYAVTKPMTAADIRGLVATFARSAANLRRAGYDGVEVHSTHGMLPEMFLSPYFNSRSDGYGGDLEGRMRLLVEILAAVRDAAGEGMAVGMRFQCDEMLPGGLTPEDCREILGNIVGQRLVDFVDLDVSVEPKASRHALPNYFLPEFFYKPYVEAIRGAAGDTPVLSTMGRITKIADAERFLAEGTVDLVGIVRGLIAEPELLKNAREGREDRSRACIGANMCQERRQYGAFGCAINPATARERRWGVSSFVPADRVGKVVVIGGGPAGLEAARVAALRGHTVVVFERESEVGGQLNLWAGLPDRHRLLGTIQWYRERLAELGVEVRTGVEATAEMVLAEQPLGVIVATGAEYVVDGESGFIPRPIPGADRSSVYTPEAILTGQVRPTGHIVVLDDEGLNAGSGVAELLAQQGAQVELLTRWGQAAAHLTSTFESGFIIARLLELGVQIHPHTHIRSIGDRSVTAFDVQSDQDQEILDVDAVVLVTMRRQRDVLTEPLDGRVDQVFAVGDALAPRALSEATFEGQRFARLLGQADAPRNFAEAYWEPLAADVFPRPAASVPVVSTGHAAPSGVRVAVDRVLRRKGAVK